MTTNTTRLNTEGALFTTPLRLASLDVSDRSCPICREPYVNPIRGRQSPVDGTEEWAVRVDMIAERSGVRRCCQHVLGRKCLEKHLHSGGPWRNKCPLCRNVWFDTTIADDIVPDQQPMVIAERNVAPSTLRRSSRIASGVSARRHQPSAHHDPCRVERRTNCPPRNAARSPHFMHHLLSLLEVETGSDEVKATMEDVERRLEILYET